MDNLPQNYYAVITASVLYRKDISSRQKILIAMISNMSNAKGYCWASNAYFAETLDCDERTIQRDITDLEDKKILNRVINLKSDGSVDFRALVIIDNVVINTKEVVTPVSGGGDTGVRGDGDTSVMYNNKDILKTNNKEVTDKSVTPSLENNLYQKAVAKYLEFLKIKLGRPGLFDGSDGKSMKQLLKYLKDSSKSKDDDGAYAGLCYILDNWSLLDEFYDDKIKVRAILSNVNNIISLIKGAKSKSPNKGEGVTAPAYRKL